MAKLSKLQARNISRKILDQVDNYYGGYTPEQREENKMITKKAGDGHPLSAHINLIIRNIKL